MRGFLGDHGFVEMGESHRPTRHGEWYSAFSSGFPIVSPSCGQGTVTHPHKRVRMVDAQISRSDDPISSHAK